MEPIKTWSLAVSFPRAMQRVHILLLLVLSSALLPFACAQSCEVYSVSSNAFCIAMTPYPIFLRNGTTQDDIGENLFHVLNISGDTFGRSIPVRALSLPPNCLAAFRSLVCSVYIPGSWVHVHLWRFSCRQTHLGCNNSGSMWQQSVRSPPCLSSCLEVSLCEDV